MSSEKTTQRTREQALVDVWESKRAPQKFPGAVWARWSDDESPKGVTRGSLRTLLRRWREGSTQLEEHPGLRKAIVSVLSEERPVTEADLFGARQGPRTPGSFPSRAFPALGAFDPEVDEPFRMATLHQVRGPRASIVRDGSVPPIDLLDLPASWRSWVTLPAGAGRSFAANQARHPPRPKSRFVVRPFPQPEVLSLVTPSVDDLDVFDEGASLLIELEAVGDQLDAFVRRLSARRGACAVLAPFHPQLPEGKFVEFVWRADASWRDGFVRWVVRRLESLGNKGSRLRVDDFLAWAARIDPEVTRFATPGDLLPLLEYAHTHGTETLTKQFGERLVRSVLTSTIERVGGTSLRDRWLRELGVIAFEKMARKWWCTSSERWDTNPSAAAWAAMVPAKDAPATTEAGERARVIAKELKKPRLPKARQTELVEELNDLLPDDVSAREAVRALVEARVLRDIGVDALGVSPPWMAEAIAKTTVERSIATAVPCEWGRWCVDPARRPFVDAHLLVLDDTRLATLITRAVEAFKKTSLGAVAAVEALFAVVGDRLVDAPRFALKREPLLKSLASIQVGLLAPHYPESLPAPRTRPGPLDPQKGGAEFVAASWAWSLRVEAPHEISPELAWLFPGWCAPGLDAIPDAIAYFDSGHAEDAGAEAGARGVQHLRALLPEVLERATGGFGDAHSNRRIPRSFADAAFPLALRRGWSLPRMVQQFRVPRLAESVRVARRIRALPDDERVRTIDALWEAVLGETKGLLEAMGYFEPAESSWQGGQRSALTVLLHERFPVEKIEVAVAEARPWDWHRGERLLSMTPEEHRPRVARALAKTLAHDVHRMIHILKAFGDELVDVLVEEATARDHSESWLVAQAVWEIAPERARALARQDYALGRIDPWITGMPEERLGELVAVVEEHSSQPVPDQLRFWLSRRLVEVGPQADDVWALLQRAGWLP